jgi:hypothetical protein
MPPAESVRALRACYTGATSRKSTAATSVRHLCLLNVRFLKNCDGDQRTLHIVRHRLIPLRITTNTAALRPYHPKGPVIDFFGLQITPMRPPYTPPMQY